MVPTSPRTVQSGRCIIMRLIMAVCICATAAFSEVSTFSLSLDSASIMSALPAAILKGAEEAYTVNMKGLDALERGELDIALEHFKNASLLLPIYSDAENNKGVVYFRKGNVSIAKMIWEDVVAKDTSYAVAWYNLGVSYVHEHAYDTAVVRFKHALELYPQFVDAMVMMGRSWLGINKPREACAALKAAYALSPKRDDVWQY